MKLESSEIIKRLREICSDYSSFGDGVKASIHIIEVMVDEKEKEREFRLWGI